MSSCLPRDEALEKEERLDEMKKIKNSPTVPHLLRAQQAPALPYAKVVGRPSTGSYPAPSPNPTTHEDDIGPILDFKEPCSTDFSTLPCAGTFIIYNIWVGWWTGRRMALWLSQKSEHDHASPGKSPAQILAGKIWNYPSRLEHEIKVLLFHGTVGTMLRS